ncbi:MAG: alpha-L-fucosidase [Bacteroidales bacterium]|jgi:alpha-L-fucosidase|nr:alpha-L-fucosidase [Bacteroidales bacterium]
MHKILKISAFAALLVPCMLHAQNKYEATWASVDTRPVPQWFSDAKFGIFIHWGIYSVPAWGPLPRDGAKGIYECYAEHYWNRLIKKNPHFVKHHNAIYGENVRYQDFAPLFKCEMFNPNEWAKLFSAAGARYVVLTSKHHEGYCLWPSAYSWNWNTVDVGPHRDLLGELTAAVRNAGIRMGYYYSLLEWFNPLYNNDINKYVELHLLPQMKELVTNYKPDILWTDGEWDHPSDKWRSAEFLAWLYNESPVRETVCVNDRWGKETRSKHGGYYTTEYNLVHSGSLDANAAKRPWEECRGIGHSFGYNRNENLDDYSSSEQLVHLLIDKVSAGGNLLLNIGPTADGRIPVIMQQRLTDIGRWLHRNGEAIYDTRAWPVASRQPDINAFFTHNGTDLFVIFTKYPDKAVTIKNVSGKPAAVTLLGSNTRIRFSQNGKNITITPPAHSDGEYAWVFKLSGIK